MKEITNKIICPYCGQEYLPSEIYVPKSFFGTQKNIERSYDGKILDFDGKQMDLEEEYKCDCCDNTFFVEAQVKFSTAKSPEKFNFNEDYTSNINIKKYSLFEDQ